MLKKTQTETFAKTNIVAKVLRAVVLVKVLLELVPLLHTAALESIVQFAQELAKQKTKSSVENVTAYGELSTQWQLLTSK
jgi:hypothetical protein